MKKYYNYHNTVKRLINEGKLIYYYYTENHNGISPALVLIFNDRKHPVMPIREHRWKDYSTLLPDDNEKSPNE